MDRVIILLPIIMLIVYYVTLMLHLFGIISLTKKLTYSGKFFLPFYLWFSK